MDERGQREPKEDPAVDLTSKPSRFSASTGPCRCARARREPGRRSQFFLQLHNALDIVFMSRWYCSLVRSPMLLRARAERISDVWGNEPMVVVGSGGRCSASSCAASRTAYSERLKSAAVSAWVRARTSSTRTPSAVAREAITAGGFVDGGSHGGGVRQVDARVLASTAFCSAKASQLRGCSGSPVSSATSCGTCWVDVDVVRASLADGFLQLGDLVRGGGEVVAPDVVAVHDAGNQGLVAQARRGPLRREPRP